MLWVGIHALVETVPQARVSSSEVLIQSQCFCNQSSHKHFLMIVIRVFIAWNLGIVAEIIIVPLSLFPCQSIRTRPSQTDSFKWVLYMFVGQARDNLMTYESSA